MKKFLTLVADEDGQDLIEYAIMAGFVAFAAGAIMPGVSTNIKKIFEKINCVMNETVCPDVPMTVQGDPVVLIRIICVALAVLFLGLIVLRRRPQEE